MPHAIMYLSVQFLVREDIDIMASWADEYARTVGYIDCARIRARIRK